MQTQMHARQHNGQRRKEVVPGFEAKTALNRCWQCFGNQKPCDDDAGHRDKQQEINQPQGIQLDAAAQDAAGRAGNPRPVQRLVQHKKSEQRQTAKLVKAHADDPLLIHQGQKNQENQIEGKFTESLFHVLLHHIPPIDGVFCFLDTDMGADTPQPCSASVIS